MLIKNLLKQTKGLFEIDGKSNRRLKRKKERLCKK